MVNQRKKFTTIILIIGNEFDVLGVEKNEKYGFNRRTWFGRKNYSM